MTSLRPKRKTPPARDVLAVASESRTKKSKAFTVFEATVAKHGEENEFLLARFLDDRNYVVLDPKVDEKLFPAPHMNAKGVSTLYEFPLQAGAQFIAEFPADKKQYLAELVVVTKSLEEASSREKFLRQLQQMNAKAAQTRSSKGKKKQTMDPSEDLQTPEGIRSPRRPLVISQESGPQSEAITLSAGSVAEEVEKDVVIVNQPALPVRLIVDDGKKSEPSGSKSAAESTRVAPVKPRASDPSIIDPDRARLNDSSKTNDASGSLTPTVPPQRVAPNPRTKEAVAVKKVLRYPYEIPQVDGIPKVPIVPKYPGIKLYIDEATLSYYRKPQNRTTPGMFLTAILDALLGGEEGVRKLHRTYLEKLAVSVARKDKQSRAGMKAIVGDQFLKCLKIFLDGEGYTTSSGAWVSDAMNRWKKRHFQRLGLAGGDEEEATAEDTEYDRVEW